MTTSAIRKLELSAAIGVPELRRHDGERLRLFRLRGAAYVEMRLKSLCK